jgi:hypothetical protein
VELLTTILKRSVGALLALIGGLLIVGIGVFMLALLTFPNSGISSSQGAFSFLVVPLVQTFVVLYFAFIAAAPSWLLFYLPCHLFIPRDSVLWRPWACVPLGALVGGAAFSLELMVITWGHDLNDGAWIPFQAILAAGVGACVCFAGSWIATRAVRKQPSPTSRN